MPPGSVEYALATLFVIRLYSVLRGEALRFLLFSLIVLLTLQGDYRALVWALVFDGILSLTEYLLKLWR